MTDGRRGSGEQEAKLDDSGSLEAGTAAASAGTQRVDTVDTQLQAGLCETLEVRGLEGSQVLRLLEPQVSVPDLTPKSM